MDRYESIGDYLLAKARILRGARRAVLPRHDAQLGQLSNVAETLSFELDEPSNDSEFGVRRKSGARLLCKGKQAFLKLQKVPLLGLHNVKNILAALALVDFLQIPRDALVKAITGFKGLPHRMQTIADHNGVTWVNDSKATNIGAASTALQNLENERDKLQAEWGRLMLEKATWSIGHNLSEDATTRLGMSPPEPDAIITVDLQGSARGGG